MIAIDPAALFGIAGSLLVLIGVLAGVVITRINKLEDRVGQAEDYNRRLWEWARKHLDLYYRHRKPDAPDPEPIPDGRRYGA